MLYYQVYWYNGAQIIPPHDSNIQKHILDKQQLDDASWDISVVKTSPFVKDPTVEIDKAYYDQLAKYVLYKYVHRKRKNV